MENWLRFSTVIALFTLLGMCLGTIAAPHFAIDAVLPQSVLAKTTPDERMEVGRRVAVRLRSHPLMYSAVGVIAVCNCVALFLLYRRRMNAP